MNYHRFMFFGAATLQAGAAYKLGTRDLHYLGEEPYERADGSRSVRLAWRTACVSCAKDVEYKTGKTAGDIPSRCRPCQQAKWDERDEARKSATQREREVVNPASAVEVYRAVQIVQGDTPRQMSLAPNSPRRIFAPAVLREAHAPLSEHTYAEILEGLDAAFTHRMIHMDDVGRYKSGHAFKGIVARDEVMLRRQGLWPKDEAPESVEADFFT